MSEGRAIKKMNDKVLMEEIAQAGSEKLDEILSAVEARYKVLFPEWEVVYLALSRNDPQERSRQLDFMVEFLRRQERHNKMLLNSFEELP